MTVCMRNGQLWNKGIVCAATCTALFLGNSASAQIVPDRTLGAESSVVRPNVDIKGLPSDRIDGGAIRGGNLFHSFQEFNVRDGRGAYFNNPAGIENIFSRVTGTNVSNIYGKLGVLGNANLFLLNPNGIIFGPNASLDVGGSFVGSTGNSFNFGGGKEFNAKNPTAPPLLSVNVPLGVQFNQEQPRAIVNSGNLSVGVGQNLNLTGGTVVSTGQLSAPGGQVAVAAVPGGSVVNLSPSAQFLNIEASPSVPSVGSSATLTELLGSSDERSHPGLTVNSNGQAELVGSGLPVVDGDVVARNVTTQTGILSANHNLTLVESQLNTTGDLNLLAGDTVRVRDSVTNPFVAQAGGQLLVQGRQGVDIFALNHPSSGLVSGGDMVLRSANTVGGDAHYWAGGNFRIEKLDGSLGGLFSPYGPVIRASGDVSFDRYSGGSLHILAGGSVNINGTVEITGTDSTNGLSETVPLSDGTTVTIDGTTSPTLDIRAGTTAFGTVGLTPNPILEIVPPNFSVAPTSVPISANIQIGSIVNNQPKGQVFLTNQYQPNNLQGSIEITGTIQTPNGLFSVVALGTPVTIDARGDLTIGNINTSQLNDTVGNVKILSERNIKTAGIISFIDVRSSGNGGDITLISRTGNIDTQGKIVSSSPRNNSQENGTRVAGNIKIQAFRDITIANEIASRVLDPGTGNAGDIQITSKSGNINLSLEEIPSTNPVLDIGGPSRIKAITSSTPNGNGGDIKLNAPQGEITTTGWTIKTESENGVAGEVILAASKDIRSGSIEASSNRAIIEQQNFSQIKLQSSGGTVFLNGVRLNTTNNGNEFAGDIRVNGKNIQITNNSNIQSKGVFGRVFIGIDEDNKVTANNVIINDSTVDIQSINGVSSDREPTQGEGIQISSAGAIQINSSNLTATTNSEAPPGSITLNANGSIDITNNSNVSNTVSGNASVQQINDYTPAITLGDSSVSSVNITNSRVNASTFGQGDAGNVIIKARDSVTFDNANAFATVEKSGIGNGGDIRISIPTGSLIVRNGAQLQALTKGKGNAGDVIIDARDITFDNANAFATVEKSGIGNGGDIRISIPTGSLIVRNGAQLTASTFGKGNAGNVIINARDSVTFDSANAFATVEESGIGKGGNISISIPTGSLIVRNGAQLQALTKGKGDAGDVIIDARDTVTFDGTSRNGQFPSAAFVRVNKDAEGSAGEIKITTGSLSITNGARLFAETLGKGKAGNIKINASGSVNISGSNSIDGRPSALFTSTSSNSTGPGGEITVGDMNKPNLFRISDGAVLFASTANNQKAGNITVNANRFETINGGQLITTTSSSGAAGTIRVNADRRVTVSGRDVTSADRNRKLGDRKFPIENIFTNPDTNRIVTNPAPNSEVFSGFYVNSQSSQSAGNIIVNSPIVFLDNKGRLIADSGSSDGGNITLEKGHLLLLGRNSLISTTAGTENKPGNGGNIEIKYPEGFIIAGFGRNNDIVANAFTGAGGKVTINALGAVNIEALSRKDLERRLKGTTPLDPQRLPTNDITAISQENPNLTGTVNLNAPNVDPTRGTIKLPENLGDSSKLIAPSCPVGIPGAVSRFVVTGRGGLPPNPSSALSTDTFLGNAANASSGGNAIASTSVVSQEAQGVEIGSRGQIILTARPSTLTPHTPWQRLTDCYGK